MRLSFTLTANAGGILQLGRRCILIDALHQERVLGFSRVPAPVLDAVWHRFGSRGPDMVLATHFHPDHFNRELWDEAQRRWPETLFLSPEDRPAGLRLSPEGGHVQLDELAVTAAHLPHEGQRFAGTPHWGYRITCAEIHVLLPGDCALTAVPGLLSLCGGKAIDLALLDFPWITLAAPRRFLQNALAPAHSGIFHLPFPSDDVNHFLPAARQAARKLSEHMDLRLYTDAWQEEVFYCADLDGVYLS